jgi:hypothetical protein
MKPKSEPSLEQKQLRIDSEFTKVIHSDYMNEFLSWFDMQQILERAKDENLALVPEENIDRFDWYIVYYFPDWWEIQKESWHKNLAYWIAYITKEWKEHKHALSDAYNKIIDGKWIFTWKWSPYEWKEMVVWAEFEISKDMRHGHKITEWPMKLFFCQWCWFRQNMECRNDLILPDTWSELANTLESQ